eukprot:2723354-Amphidinium_carterae.1
MEAARERYLEEEAEAAAAARPPEERPIRVFVSCQGTAAPVEIIVLPFESVSVMCNRASKALGKGVAALRTLDGRALDDGLQIRATGLRNGDFVTAWLRQVVKAGGVVVTWGNTGCGGDRTAVLNELVDLARCQWPLPLPQFDS